MSIVCVPFLGRLDRLDHSRPLSDWSVDRIDLTADGRYVLAFGDSHRRAQVWETRTGARLLTLAGGDRRHGLHGGIVRIGGTPYVLSAVRDEMVVQGTEEYLRAVIDEIRVSDPARARQLTKALNAGKLKYFLVRQGFTKTGGLAIGSRSSRFEPLHFAARSRER